MLPSLLQEGPPRREITDGPLLVPSQHNQRELELVALQQAPDRPRHGDHPPRPARRQVYSSLARRSIRSVMALHQSGVIRRLHAVTVAQPQGKQLTWDERANIERRQPESYGTRFIVKPLRDTAYEERMRAEMGL